MSRFFLFLLLGILSFSVYANDFKRSVHYIEGEGSWPLAFYEGERVKGIIPESVYEIFRTIEVDVVTRMVPDVRIVYELAQQRVDVSAVVMDYNGISKTDYPSFLYICPEPILHLDVHAVWRKDAKIDTAREYNLDEFKVGILKISPNFRYIFENNNKNKIKFRSLELLVKNLIGERVDLILMNGLHAELLASRFTSDVQLQQGQLVARMPVHLAVSKHWLKPGRLMDRLCGNILTLKNNNVFGEIFDYYLNDKLSN